MYKVGMTKLWIVIDKETILGIVIDSFYTFFPKAKTKKINVIIHCFSFEIEQMIRSL